MALHVDGGWPADGKSAGVGALDQSPPHASLIHSRNGGVDYSPLLKRAIALVAAWATSDSMHVLSPEHGAFLVRLLALALANVFPMRMAVR